MADNEEEVKKNDITESTDTEATTQKPRTTRKKKSYVTVLGEKIDVNALGSTAKEGLCNSIHSWKRSGSLSITIRTAMLKNLGIDSQGWKREYSITEFISSMNELGNKLDCTDDHGKKCCQ